MILMQLTEIFDKTKDSPVDEAVLGRMKELANKII